MPDQKAMCSKCKKEKPVVDFPKRSDGRYVYCKECNREYQREWYTNNRLDQLAKQAEYRGQKDVQKRAKETSRRYYERNRERLIQAAKENYKQNRSRKLQTQKVWDKANKRKCKDACLRHNFGSEFGIEQYEAMLDEQNGVCAICGKNRHNSKSKHLAVDHCHTSGKIRGLLCQFCNRGLGFLGDDAESLERALEYVRRDGLPHNE